MFNLNNNFELNLNMDQQPTNMAMQGQMPPQMMEQPINMMEQPMMPGGGFDNQGFSAKPQIVHR